MKRPMAWVGLSFFSALILFCIYGLQAAIAGGLVSPCLLLLLLCIPRARRQRLFQVLCLAVLAACLLISAQIKLVLEPVLSYVGKTLPVTAQVVSLTESRNGRYYTILLVTQAGGEKVRFRLRYSGKTPLPAELYDTVEATLRIDALGESEAARRSYRAKGIFLRGSTYEPVTVTPRENVSLACRLLELRKGMLAALNRYLPGEEGKLLGGMLLGETAPVSEKVIQDFRTCGVSHLLAVSGLHTSLWAMFLFRMLQKLKWSRRVSAACSMGFVLFFMGLAGFSPSVTRAGIMMLLYLGGFLLRREPDSLNSLGLAALVILFANPFAAADLGMLLSFSATAGILLLQKPFARVLERPAQHMPAGLLRKACKGVAELLAVTLAAIVFTLPVSILSFGQVSLIAPLANLLFVNAGGAAMLCAGLCAALSHAWIFSFLAYPFALIGGLLSQYLLGGTALLSKLPFASVSLEPGASALWLAGTVVLLAIVLLDRNRTQHLARLAALCSAFALLAGVFAYTLMGRNLTAITMADVGNGTAIVLTRGRRAAVIGCGGDYDAAAQVSAVLQSQNVTALDLLFLPRAAQTEASAAGQLLESIPAQTVVCAEAVDGLPNGTHAVVAGVGRVRLWGDVTLEYITQGALSCALLEIGTQRFFLSFCPGGELSRLPEGWSSAPVAFCRAQGPKGLHAGVTLFSGEGDRVWNTARAHAQNGRKAFATGGKGALRIRADGAKTLDIKRLP